MIYVKGILRDSGVAIAGWYLEIPEDTHQKLNLEPRSRVMMTLGEDRLHRALRLSTNGYAYITVNLKLIDKYHLKEGATVEIGLEPDHSEFGMELSEEMVEVMEQDPEGKELFLRANAGVQRGFLHYISSAKGVQTRINRALHVMNRLRELKEEGKIK
ncbi:MAG: YdeI/OmpD-associated family protein [Bacteroidota bacterium]|nr:YdeI/OmpD-associated family protein [Bacteroidota bacterium]MDX5429594.1 YdeI/OmpD-associated family protein [Bacteroidota bacterium]MDX5468378.1 YdeI/OmpD-associated family protein [Bacteroidota bacterium]